MSRAEDVIEEAINGSLGDGLDIIVNDCTLVAQAVIEAIRNMSPDDLAELIGGEVEQKVNFEHRCIVGRTVIKRFRTNEPWPEQRKETP